MLILVSRGPDMLWPDGSKTQPAVSSPFGPRPVAAGTTASSIHRGTDFIGFPVVGGVAAGVVVQAGSVGSWPRGGQQVWVQHDGFFTRSLHLAAVYVRVGDRVGEGTPLGLMGQTGDAYGVHLHFELTPGEWHFGNVGQVDPVGYISGRVGGFAGGGSSPFPVSVRSGKVEWIVRLNGVDVYHITPGVKYKYRSSGEYNTFRNQLAKLRAAGATNAIAMPALASVANVDTGQFDMICRLNGV